MIPHDSTPTGHILVVDDEASNCELVREILEPQGHTVEQAVSGADALARIAAAPPDVVLLDVSMPGMDGYEVCRRLRADPKTAALPVIMVTAQTDRRDRLTGIEAGANDYLAKPVDLQHLVLRVRNALFAKRLSDEVQRSYTALKREVELRENLTNMLVHDLRSPLGVMMLSLELVRTLAIQKLAENERNSLLIAERSIKNMMEMVSSILDVSKLEADEMKLRLVPADLARLATSAVEPYSVAVHGQCRVGFMAPSGPLKVECDTELIRRAIANLVGNAVKFTPAAGRVLVRASLQDGMACLEVVDNGPGIAVDFHGKIFEKFVQADGGKRRYGTGLGLYFCKLAVEAHGGHIGVRSEMGKGSTFWFTLPAPPPPAAA